MIRESVDFLPNRCLGRLSTSCNYRTVRVAWFQHRQCSVASTSTDWFLVLTLTIRIRLRDTSEIGSIHFNEFSLERANIVSKVWMDESTRTEERYPIVKTRFVEFTACRQRFLSISFSLNSARTIFPRFLFLSLALLCSFLSLALSISTLNSLWHTHRFILPDSTQSEPPRLPWMRWARGSSRMFDKLSYAVLSFSSLPLRQ